MSGLARSAWQQSWRRVRQDPVLRALGGAWCVLVALCAGAELWESWLGVSALEPSLRERFLPVGFPHLLGTDDLGRDVFVRLCYGGRTSLAVALGASLLSVVWGLGLGTWAGFRGGVVDRVSMALTDAFLALPTLPLLLLAASLGGPGDPTRALRAPPQVAALLPVLLLLTAFGWMPVARVARAAALRARVLPYVDASRLLGATSGHILRVHLLPALLPPVITTATLGVAGHILAESSLSFLGLGVPPPLPTWGNMLAHAVETLRLAPALALWPGALILLTAWSCYLAGDRLRDALDPHFFRPESR